MKEMEIPTPVHQEPKPISIQLHGYVSADISESMPNRLLFRELSPVPIGKSDETLEETLHISEETKGIFTPIQDESVVPIGLEFPVAEIYPEEIEEQEERLEEDFQTLEAQKAFYEFMRAVRVVDIKTGRNGEMLLDAMEGVKIHAKDMSINKLFAIMVVSISLLLEAWGEKINRDGVEQSKEEYISKYIQEEKTEDAFEKKPEPIVIKPFDMYISQKPYLAA